MKLNNVAMRLVFLFNIALLLLSSAQAQLHCVGIGYKCDKNPRCNPFKCAGRGVDCPHRDGPCCIPVIPGFNSGEIDLAFKALMLAKEAEKPLLEEARRNSTASGLKCNGTANACLKDSECCSGRCSCKMIISKVCCAPVDD